jgi:hypothetical protein
VARAIGADVLVRVYETWARLQARRVFPDIPRRESEGGAAGIAHLKRHPALALAIAELAQRPPARVDDDDDLPDVVSNALARHADLQHLFGDATLLRAVAAASDGNVLASMVDDVLEHTHIQFSIRTEEEFAHVLDKERLVPVDGRTIDAGTPHEHAGTVDPEDYAVLFELDRLRAARARTSPVKPRRYDCIVVDEAQEFAPLELALIGRSLAPGGTLIVAGDADQQLDPHASFRGWEKTMEALGLLHYETRTLEVGYRCPPAVTRLARALVRPSPLLEPSLSAPALPPSSASPSLLAEFAHELHLAAWLAAELDGLAAVDPRASVAVICRTALAARRLAPLVRAGAAARLVLDGEFVFGVGAHVTPVDQVKGLEFDHVVVPDASLAAYPDTSAARRALYVATTRARHQVVFACVGPRSPLLEAGLRTGDLHAIAHPLDVCFTRSAPPRAPRRTGPSSR